MSPTQSSKNSTVIPVESPSRALAGDRVRAVGGSRLRSKCFDAQAAACAQYLKGGREIAVDGRLLFHEFQTQDGAYASRIYIVAERVEFLASRKPSNGQASDEA